MQRCEKMWGVLTLFGPCPPEAERDEGDDDEDEGSQDYANYEVGKVTRPRHQASGKLQPRIWALRWRRPLVIRTRWGDKSRNKMLTKCSNCWSHFTFLYLQTFCKKEEKKKKGLTFRFKDYYVAEFALSLLVEALHLDVVGGLRLQVCDWVPVSVTLHHILLIITVIIAVSRPVVDVEAVDGRVVYGSVLLTGE